MGLRAVLAYDYHVSQVISEGHTIFAGCEPLGNFQQPMKQLSPEPFVSSAKDAQAKRSEKDYRDENAYKAA